jgi:hypothetical protein
MHKHFSSRLLCKIIKSKIYKSIRVILLFRRVEILNYHHTAGSDFLVIHKYFEATNYNLSSVWSLNVICIFIFLALLHLFSSIQQKSYKYILS